MAQKKATLANCTASAISPGGSTIKFMQAQQHNWLLTPIRNSFLTKKKKHPKQNKLGQTPKF